MSTPGDVRRPSTTKPKPAAGAKPGTKATAKPAKSAAGGGKGRKPVAPIKVSQGRNWGPIILFSAAGVLAVSIITFGAVKVWQQDRDQRPWQERAAAIPGIIDYNKTKPDMLKFGPEGNHKNGTLTYQVAPPAGGVHNPSWQNCMGDVYTAPLANEHAVHSEEHGAVWITYRPDLPQDQIDKLAAKVKGQSYMMMSPYPGQDRPISLQTWAYQLKVDDAGDTRIDDFIRALRVNASQETGVGCDGGITEPGLHDIEPVTAAS
jgi:hypothetical protein